MAMTLFHNLYQFLVAVGEVIDEAIAMRNAAQRRNPGLSATE